MILLVIHIAFIMLPTLSIRVRRLHDIGKRGELFFVGLVPFFYGITLLVLLCRDSMTEANEFGPSPKYTPLLPMQLYRIQIKVIVLHYYQMIIIVYIVHQIYSASIDNIIVQ